MERVNVDRVSVIINNYNYGRYLPDAVDSALEQTYPNVEIVVVDDGSSDNSAEDIGRYGERIVPVLKSNGGQASAFNAGFRFSAGELVIFLDSDDVLLPTAVEQVVERYRETNAVQIDWPLRIIDEHGQETGHLKPGEPLSNGDLREMIIRDGPDSYVRPPTSGNAWSRSFLVSVLPAPEPTFRVFADLYLFTLAPVFGVVASLPEPQGFYRVHADNNSRRNTVDERLREYFNRYEVSASLLVEHLGRQGIATDPELWKQRNPGYIWMRQLHVAIDELAALIPPGETFILVNEDSWEPGEIAEGRYAVPFLEKDGQYWGPPPDDATAIRELERLRASGARYITFAWSAFWWLDYYGEFHGYLRSTFERVLNDDHLVVFDLRTLPGVEN